MLKTSTRIAKRQAQRKRGVEDIKLVTFLKNIHD